MKHLLTLQFTHTHLVGRHSLAVWLQRAIDDDAGMDLYEESAAAKELLAFDKSFLGNHPHMRLAAKAKDDHYPIYAQPRVVRFAALMGMDMIELDISSSHLNAFWHIAEKLGAERNELRHFATYEGIIQFRASQGIDRDIVKALLVQMMYGAGEEKLLATCRAASLPPGLQRLRKELIALRKRIMAEVPLEWRRVSIPGHRICILGPAPKEATYGSTIRETIGPDLRGVWRYQAMHAIAREIRYAAICSA